VERVQIIHRKGVLKPGEVSLLIAVSSKHRQEAFFACWFIIEEIKKSLPIWKKEIFEDGEEWVEG
jgi:molybdopterin synthase catalytic subunit